MGVDGPLGNLNYLRILHDNGGKGNMASWDLKFVIVHDVQTKEKHYFLCEKWLGVEKGDGLIDRILPIAGDKQKTEIKYLVKKQAKQNMRDGHLWFSVFARPVQSRFTRLGKIQQLENDQKILKERFDEKTLPHGDTKERRPLCTRTSEKTKVGEFVSSRSRCGRNVYLGPQGGLFLENQSGSLYYIRGKERL